MIGLIDSEYSVKRRRREVSRSNMTDDSRHSDWEAFSVTGPLNRTDGAA